MEERRKENQEREIERRVEIHDSEFADEDVCWFCGGFGGSPCEACGEYGDTETH